ncbi:MAG: autoinducer binding domain-containing protein [Pseudomonadales bacterium]
MYDAQSVEQKFDACVQAITALGFDGLAYSYIPRFQLETKSESSPVFLASDSYPKHFLTQYSEQDLAASDFTIREINNGNLAPIDWWHYADAAQLKRSELRVIEIARYDYGIINGYSIPTMSDERGVAGASLISFDRTPSGVTELAQRMQQAVMYVSQFHQQVILASDFDLRFKMPLLAQFTPTERLIIDQLRCGTTSKKLTSATQASSQKAIARLLQKISPNDQSRITRERFFYLLHTLF